MAEYIERDSTIAALNKVRDDQRVFKYATASDFLSARDAIERAIKVLESLPTADVEPVKHGRWIEKQEKDTFDGYLYSYECSECGRVKQRKEPYCPNCRARMDEEDNT